jgi:hypothetical protein
MGVSGTPLLKNHISFQFYTIYTSKSHSPCLNIECEKNMFTETGNSDRYIEFSLSQCDNNNGGKPMGTVFAEITLKNGSDLVRLQDGTITDKDVRSLTVNAVVDTGAVSLVINEEIRLTIYQQLLIPNLHRQSDLSRPVFHG